MQRHPSLRILYVYAGSFIMNTFLLPFGGPFTGWSFSQDYEGEREFDDLAKFAKDNLGPRCLFNVGIP